MEENPQQDPRAKWVQRMVVAPKCNEQNGVYLRTEKSRRRDRRTLWSTYLHLFAHFVLLTILGILLFLRSGSAAQSLGFTTECQQRVPFDYRVPPPGSGDTLYPGELPGYTGWARPRATVAPDIHLESASWTRDDKWTAIFQLEEHLISKNGPSFDCTKIRFFARAYGPAVSVARTRYNADDGDRCSITVDFLIYDPGSYFVEVVVTFSQVPGTDLFPLDHKSNMFDPFYEGYMIPGFPRQVVQTKSPLGQRQQQRKNYDRVCSVRDIQMDNSQQELGRWVVTGKAGSKHFKDSTSEDVDMTLESYQKGQTSLAVSMEYKLLESCTIPNQLEKTSRAKKQMHVFFIGDSIMRLQYFRFRDHRATFTSDTSVNLTLSYISNHDGMYEKMENVTSEVSRAIQATKPGTEFIVIYNTGLHDIGRLCGSQFAKVRLKSKDTLMRHRNYSCLPHYKSLLGELTDFLLQALPEGHRHLFFQTTTAGWPKWGNYGFGWPPTEAQVYTKSPEFCTEINQAAFDVLRSRTPDVAIVDGYWITLARPDHREADEDQYIGKHLVHPGPEVVDAMQGTVCVILYEVVAEQ